MAAVQTVYYRRKEQVLFTRVVVVRVFSRREEQKVFYEIKPCEI